MRRVEPYCIGIISGYEFAALVAHSPHVPTITALTARLPRVARRCLAVCAGVWLYRHWDN